ncbi:unnamed protein product [Lymnaea stagnalis]|uniref:Uncharacterized protein n=1 Tax=Lymnaea stagnalis TaxID=6523 RepID=A0AAV2HSF3_LYMST
MLAIFLKVSLIYAAVILCAHPQKITVYDYKQEQSQSQCTNGLISDVDVVVFQCLVDYSQDRVMKSVVFQTKKISETRFSFLDDCNIQEDCRNSKYADGVHIDIFLLEITIRVKATKSLSGAKFRGQLYASNNKQIPSNEQKFPQIADVSDVNGILILNGKKITQPTECYDVFTRSPLNIVFMCQSQVLPCLVAISNNESTETVNGSGLVTWNKEYYSQREVYLHIKYAVCRLNERGPTFICKFIIGNVSSPEENKAGDITTPVLISIAIGVPVLSCLICLLVVYKHKEFGLFFRRISTCILKTDQANCKYETCIMNERQNLMEDFKTCSKNKKHSQFIPSDNFTKEHLPQMDLDSDILEPLFDLINLVADLTVRVRVLYISHDRPHFFPDEKHPYPFSDKKGDTVTTRLGTAFIKRVVVIQKTDGLKCPCYKCLKSNDSGKAWGKVYISTAKSLIFDNSEARFSTFKISFNKQTGDYYYLNGSRVTQSDLYHDQCYIECVTCDEDLLNLLSSKTKGCKQQMSDVNSKYNEGKCKDKLTIIVSNPHGCPEHVSLGHWTNRYVVAADDSKESTKYIYTTPTCPGCIGAFVYILGASDISLKHHVHCGFNEEINNFSSTGIEKIWKAKL